ncbi:hypothetical protein B4U79_05993 [Dinothrombium tinctorium]|uniref:Uncharacterized protein n=1 Tax=Dinothrombium tinctorium TaxID=1965070 RepID=A0A3S3QB39_9ACAR|nr:hypothetical protein B4U79_05993 [Dinothrombium tinctorium]
MAISPSLIDDSCNNGVGKLVYEKVSDYRLNGVQTFGNKPDREIINRNELPIKVLEECIRRCQEDKVSIIESCHSFDFAPGQRRSSPYQQQINAVSTSITADYEDSQCILHFNRAAPDGKDSLVQQPNAWHFNEVCLSSKKLTTDCSNRLYVFERIPNFRFDGNEDKEVYTKNRTECEDMCLNETETPCRSASFDRTTNKCTLSRETRYMNPRGFKADPNADYVENMCLKRSQMCTSTAFILETSKELEGVYERELISAQDFQECSNYCIGSLEERGFLCRSFMFDDKGRTCILYDEDPLFYGEISHGQDPRALPHSTRPLKSSTGNLYRVLCVNTGRGENTISNATLECYRRKRLDGPHEVEITTYSFFDCLEECTRRYGRNCKSVEYSSQHRSCRFSSGLNDELGITNLVDDPNYDYYKFIWYRSSNGGVGSYSQHVPMPQETYHSGFGYGYPPLHGPYGAWRDPHRGGYGYDRQQPTYGYPMHIQPPPMHSGMSSFASRHGTFSSSNLGSYGSPMPNIGSFLPPPQNPQPPPTQQQSPLPNVPSSVNPPPPPPQMQNGPMPTYGIPYHSFPPATIHNTLTAPFPPPPFPPNFPGDRCKFPTGAPFSTRFNRIGFGSRLRNTYIFKVVRADKLEDCERACVESRDFICRSFNYRAFFPAENCELSQYDSKQLKLDNPAHFEQHTQYDYFERDTNGGMGGMGPGFQSECLEVSQTCTPDGMEFTLKTPEGFYGRIYTYGFYDSCFYDGNGGTVSVLRISRANGFPRCGTQQYGDAMTNIVVVQFNDFVQTSRDKKYNLTCYFSGPGEAVVTSNYLDTKTDGRYPTQIEHLPAQNILTSNVVLRILYRGTPTNTIVVGDLLTFRLEARGHYRYDYFNSDIFATNVIAKDPYTGRQVHLIDSRGCPVDLYVFPELHKTPDGALEAEFYAFKIPDSNFLVFQATVRTCRGPCEPVICADRGRGHGSFPSWGRKKRSVNESEAEEVHHTEEEQRELNYESVLEASSKNVTGEEEEVHELLRVYLSREDIPNAESEAQVMEKTLVTDTPSVCVAQSGYYGLITAVILLTTLLLAIGIFGFLMFRKTKFSIKETQIEVSNPNLYVNQFHKSSTHQKLEDPSEPIYTDPSLFERSRSLRSLTISTLDNAKQFSAE